ncbi:MAG: RHS repeat-associated core domain-containing protein [Prevotella sp.]
MLQCITFMAYAHNSGGACITYRTYTTSDASGYIAQKVYDNGSRATYLYSADGTKFQVKYETSYTRLLASGPPSGSASTAIADIHTIDYVGNKIYEDGVLSRILVEGGYVDYNGGTPIYHAYLTDHQGNVRVVVDENAAVKQVNHYYPYGALFAESTNGDVQPYKYNGKELDRMHGLDWYDHGARHNDAAIGRWHVMDPLCEKYYDVSPYAYCAGDSVNAIDPDGKIIWTKILKATMKIGSRVASNGLRELGKASTYAEAISDIKENATTVVDGNASTIDPIGAGVSSASELLPVSVGDVKDVVKIVKNVHGNSKLSTKAQHAYDIIDKRTGKVVKTGISGGKIRKDGKSYRAEQQVRKWNKEEGGDIYESKITHQEPAGAGARDKILKYEKDRANTLITKKN